MIDISKQVLELPKKDLQRWINDMAKHNTTQDWKDKLAELKAKLEDAKGISRKGKKD